MLHQLPDLTGPISTAQALASTVTRCNWVKLSSWNAVHENVGVARVGDANVSTTEGCPIPPNEEVNLFPASGANSFDLSQTFIVIPTSADVIQVSFNTV
jgi:hypothetical protein